MNLFRNIQENFKFFLKKEGNCGKKLSFGNGKAPKNRLFDLFRSFFVVRLIGLEPTRPESPDPKSGASTNSATSALYKRARFVNAGAKVQKKNYSTKSLRANSIKVSLPRAKSSSVWHTL